MVTPCGERESEEQTHDSERKTGKAPFGIPGLDAALLQEWEVSSAE